MVLALQRLKPLRIEPNDERLGFSVTACSRRGQMQTSCVAAKHAKSRIGLDLRIVVKVKRNNFGRGWVDISSTKILGTLI